MPRPTRPTSATTARVPSAWRDRRVPWQIELDAGYALDLVVACAEDPSIAAWADDVVRQFAAQGTAPTDTAMARLRYKLEHLLRFKRDEWRLIARPIAHARKLVLVRLRKRRANGQSAYFALVRKPKARQSAS